MESVQNIASVKGASITEVKYHFEKFSDRNEQAGKRLGRRKIVIWEVAILPIREAKGPFSHEGGKKLFFLIREMGRALNIE